MVAKEGSSVIKTRDLSGGTVETTNNQMELTAAIMALEALEKPSKITIVTDSSYVKDGITKWIFAWKRNGWKTAAKKSVKNEELWKRLENATQIHDVSWEWIKGHAGHLENERADELARNGMEPFKN
jgi:ribonuclease HI